MWKNFGQAIAVPAVPLPKALEHQGTSQTNDSKCLRYNVRKTQRTFCESFVVVLLLTNITVISASMKILDNISVIISTKKYDTNTSLNFSSHTSLWYGNRLGKLDK